MATSNSPLAYDADTGIDEPPILEPDYNEPIEDPDSGELPEDEPEDEVPEEDPDDEPLAVEDEGLDVPVGEDTAESDDEIFRRRHAEAEARQSKP
jgi:hypothetical protein